MKIGKINRQSIGISGFTSGIADHEGMPTKLFIAGTLPKDHPPTVAIVGSRCPSPYGKEVTRRLARELAEQGIVIISGLAYGIDAIAHEAALEAGGTTIAVLANGLHRIYPAVHTGLAERIVAQGGALISEQALGVDARKHHFLSRNRLISGLADAVIVTEATDRSGTFSTVAHAITQNKEVCAVPGPITSLLSAGPNRLIQEGAHVVLNSQDILSLVAPQMAATQRPLPLGNTPLETTLIKLIQSGVQSGEMLQRQCGASVNDYLQALTMLELNGVVRNLGANMWGLD